MNNSFVKFFLDKFRKRFLYYGIENVFYPKAQTLLGLVGIENVFCPKTQTLLGLVGWNTTNHSLEEMQWIRSILIFEA